MLSCCTHRLQFKKRIKALGKLQWLYMLLLSLCVGCLNEDKDLTTPVSENTSVSSSTTVNHDDTSATIRFALNDSEMMLYEGVVQAFESENPHLKIQLVSANEILDFDPASGSMLPEDAALRLAQSADVFTNQPCYGRCPTNLTPETLTQP